MLQKKNYRLKLILNLIIPCKCANNYITPAKYEIHIKSFILLFVRSLISEDWQSCRLYPRRQTIYEGGLKSFQPSLHPT